MIDIELGLGLNRDSSPLNQPKGSYTYAMNVVTDKSNKGSISNERGTVIYKSIAGDILGSCFISPDEQVLFTSKNYIYLLNTITGELISYNIPALNLSTAITAEARVVNGCERVVYFTDGVNPRRFFDFDNVSNFKTNGQFDIEKFSLSRAFTPPTIKTTVLTSGGSLRYGVYNFVVQYLDENENVLYTSPVDINYTPITESSNKGGLNIDTNDVSAGGKPEAGRAINIEVTGTGKAEYARLVVLRTTTSDGFTADAHIVGEIIPIANNSFTYVYKGFNVDAGDYTIDKNEVLVDKAIYKTAVVQEQVQDRLLQANLTEETLDYYSLQAYANNIQVKWVAKKEPVSDIRNRTRMSGDKKALGIVYVMEDGSFSDVYLLQSQAGTTEGGTGYELPQNQITVKLASSIINAADIPYWDGSFTIVYQVGEGEPITIQREFIPNFDNETATGQVFIAEEYEIIVSSTEHLTVLSFETRNQDISYVADVTTFKESSATVDPIPLTGFELSGNTGIYEASQLYEQPVNASCKTEPYWGELENETVQYHVMPNRSQVPIVENGYAYNIGFHFSNITYPPNVKGHFFVESIGSDIQAKGILTPLLNKSIGDETGSLLHASSGENPKSKSKLANLLTADFLYGKSYVSGDFISIEGYWNYNNTVESETVEFEGTAIPYKKLNVRVNKFTPTDFVISAEKDYSIANSYIINEKSKLDGIENYSLTNTFNVLRFDSNMNFDTSNVMRYVTVHSNVNPFTNMYSLRFRRITDFGQNISFAGDTFITPLRITNVASTNYRNKFLAKDEISTDCEILDTVYVESRINTKTLHDGLDDCDKHYPSSNFDTDVFIDKLAERNTDGYTILKDPICKLWTGYNMDYSRISDFNIYNLTRRTYNYCSDCIGSFPNRIIYSERSFQERIQDNYRIFKVNNYVDLPANKGSIQGMDYKNGQLWIRTQYSCFVITPNPQQLALDGTTVEIGTGDFLSVQEQELNAVDIGYGGQLHPHESINTEHGLVWVDRTRGKVLMVAGQLEELSRKGMYDYFFNSLKVEEHIRLGYDPVHERLLLTNLGTGETISYCFESQMWKSFHSYKPTYYLYDKENMYSFDFLTDTIYKHNSENYLDSTAELFFKDSSPFTLQTVFYYEKHFNQDGSLNNTTFSNVLVYNQNQCSGYKQITQDGQATVFYNAGSVKAIKKNNIYKISPIRDLAIGTPVLNENQEANVDINKPQSEHKKFNDKWIAIRLLDKSKVKYVLDYVQTMKYYIDLYEIASKNQLG